MNKNTDVSYFILLCDMIINKHDTVVKLPYQCPLLFSPRSTTFYLKCYFFLENMCSSFREKYVFHIKIHAENYTDTIVSTNTPHPQNIILHQTYPYLSPLIHL